MRWWQLALLTTTMLLGMAVWLAASAVGTYMATNRSGFGSNSAYPSRRPTDWSATDKSCAISKSSTTGGSGGSGAGMNAA
jgi:hypothetical protein